MRARATAAFFDLAEGVDRRPGDEFEATPERIAEINARLDGYVVAVGEGEQSGAPAPAPKRRTAARKAPVKR